MSNFIVRVDHLDDQQLAFYGWICVDQDDEFTLYWNPRHNEMQPVSNKPPRYLIIDDVNDAQYMSRDNRVMAGPQRRN